MEESNKQYFILEHKDREVFHGGIGNVDAEKIFEKKGFMSIFFPYHHSFSIKAKIFRFAYLLKTFFTLPKGALVIFQFPLYARMNSLLLRMLRFRKSIRIICFIADINGLKDGDEQLLQREKEELKTYSLFIVHGTAMEKWLHSFHPTATVSQLQFFDFLTPLITTIRHKTMDVAFAGNLEKSTFLEALGSMDQQAAGLRFLVYGKEPSRKLMQQPNVIYKGFAEPYRLPSVLEGSFGLVWDGDSIDGAGGSLGNYMQYISHHKLSLYILSGMPLIVPSMAASAQLIKDYQIGFTIDRLAEIEEKIRQLPEDEYRAMQDRTRPLAKRIASGDNLSDAIDQLTANLH